MKKSRLIGISLIIAALIAALVFRNVIDIPYTTPLDDSQQIFGELYGPTTYFRPYAYMLLGLLASVGFLLCFFRR